MRKLYTAGELAKLCNVNKSNVLYYDRIGLLKPDYVAKNGYRYYSENKTWQLVNIKVLVENNVSLKEIADLNEDINIENYYKLLDMRINEMIDEKKTLEFMIRCNKERVCNLNLLQAGKLCECFITYCPEEYYIAGPWVDSSDIDNTGIAWKLYNEHIEYMENNNILNSYIEGYNIIELDGKLTNSKSRFITKIFERIDNERLFVKPAGNYLTLLDKGGAYYKAYEFLLKYAEENNLKLEKMMYNGEMFIYGEDVEEYIWNYQIRIL